jgi:outer membrane protein assembly factor BamB
VDDSLKTELSPHTQVTFHTAPNPLAKNAVVEDWTSFLGPRHNCTSLEKPLLLDWGEKGPSLVWELETGTGYSSPAIAHPYLVYFHRIENREVVECLHHETGQRYWKYEYESDYKDRYGYNNGPRASPVIDGSRVYTYGAQGVLHCLHLPSGQVDWKRDLKKEFNVPQDFFGVATTPLIHGEHLIINLGVPGGPCVIALDKKTGALVWGAGTKWGASYASPIPATLHGQPRVFVFAGGESNPPTGGLISLDPRDGKIDFEFPWRSESYESVNASCPTLWGNKVFISASYYTGGAALEILPDFSHRVLWTSDLFGTHFATSIVKDGYLYGFDGRHSSGADLVCFEANTGIEKWRERPQWEETVRRGGRQGTRKGGVFRGTLLQTGEEPCLCLGEGGDLLWVDLSPEGYRERARTSLFSAPETWALPVLSHGLLYISQNYPEAPRESPRLLCFDLRGK